VFRSESVGVRLIGYYGFLNWWIFDGHDGHQRQKTHKQVATRKQEGVEKKWASVLEGDVWCPRHAGPTPHLIQSAYQ